jgi:hypothetical protein
VVVTGVVDSPLKAQKVLNHARSIDNVTSVRSFIQVRPPTDKREPR